MPRAHAGSRHARAGRCRHAGSRRARGRTRWGMMPPMPNDTDPSAAVHPAPRRPPPPRPRRRADHRAVRRPRARSSRRRSSRGPATTGRWWTSSTAWRRRPSCSPQLVAIQAHADRRASSASCRRSGCASGGCSTSAPTGSMIPRLETVADMRETVLGWMRYPPAGDPRRGGRDPRRRATRTVPPPADRGPQRAGPRRVPGGVAARGRQRPTSSRRSTAWTCCSSARRTSRTRWGSRASSRTRAFTDALDRVAAAARAHGKAAGMLRRATRRRCPAYLARGYGFLGIGSDSGCSCSGARTQLAEARARAGLTAPGCRRRRRPAADGARVARRATAPAATPRTGARPAAGGSARPGPPARGPDRPRVCESSTPARISAPPAHWIGARRSSSRIDAATIVHSGSTVEISDACAAPTRCAPA